MTSTNDTNLVLFVAGEPDPGLPSLGSTTMPIIGRLIGAFTSLRLVMGPPESPGSTAEESRPAQLGSHPWHLPPEHVRCVNLVLQLAEQEGTELSIVDVNRADERQDLISRWVGVDDSFPLLVRRDGARLEGIESFVPRRVREFIRARSVAYLPRRAPIRR